MFSRTSSLADHFFSASRWIFYGFLFLFPLFFLPFTLDPVEMNKQTLLLFVAFVSGVLLTGGVLLKKEMRFSFGWPLVFPLLLLAAFILSATQSFAPYLSWVGLSGSEYMSVLTWGSLVLLFYLQIWLGKDVFSGSIALVLLVLGSTLAGLVGVLSFVGLSVIPFFPMLSTSIFNPVGTPNLLAVFLIVVSMFALALGVSRSELWKQPLWKRILLFFMFGLLWIETGVVLLVLDYVWLWLLLFVGCGTLFVFFLFRASSFTHRSLFIVPVIFTVASILFGFWLPNPLPVHAPVEVGLNAQASSTIAKQTLDQTSRLFGTGPGTYAMDYAKYHGTSINQTDFWNIRFDRASSFVLTLVPTVGYLGSGFYLIFVLSLLSVALIYLFKHKQDRAWLPVFDVFVPWFTLVVASCLFPFNSALVILFMVFSAWVAVHVMEKEKTFRFSSHPVFAFLTSVLFVICGFVLLVAIFLTAERYVAEASYAKAIRADRTKAQTKELVTQLDHAATLNRFNDDYVRNLSQVLLLRVREELKTVTPSSPLSDASKKYIQALVAASVNASVKATDLSSHTVENWLSRGNVYRSLTGLVDGASTFAVDAYVQATDLEPSNPNHWTELGKTYLIMADTTQPLTLSKDDAAVRKAKADWQSQLDHAEEAFSHAITLKSNYAPAHFQLALVYEREGKLDQAIAKLESVEKYNDSDVGVGFELGTLYLKRGVGDDFERARGAFEHVVILAPSYSDAHWFLASIYEKQGRQADAVKEIETVLKLNPDNMLVKTRLQKLKEGMAALTTTPPPELKK